MMVFISYKGLVGSCLPPVIYALQIQYSVSMFPYVP